MNSYIYSTGKRKRSVARIFLKVGSGIISINNTSNYFSNFERFICLIRKPLKALDLDGRFDIMVTVKGGGTTGQSEAIRHGISKAIIKSNFFTDEEKVIFKKNLKGLGFLTRDPREVERKKVGRRKARKKEQYSKR